MERDGAHRPLAGFRVINTRAAHQQERLNQRLRALGAAPVPAPTTQTRLLTGELAAALAEPGALDLIILTSPNGAQALAQACPSGKRLPALAAVGPRGAEVLGAAGLPEAFVPKIHSAQGLLQELPQLNGAAVLLVQGDQAPDELARGLRAAGAKLRTVLAYRTQPINPNPSLEAALDNGAEAIVFAAGSAAEAASAALHDLPARLAKTAIISMGPSTSRRLLSLGLNPSAEARHHNLDGLTDAVVRALGAAA